MGILPSRRGNKKPKHGSSRSGVIETSLLIPPANVKQPSTMQILDMVPYNPPDVTLSKPPNRPPNSGPKTLLKSEGLACDRFKQVVSDKDVAICYDKSMKDFKQSTVNNFFKVL